jgi:hypothetical protein
VAPEAEPDAGLHVGTAEESEAVAPEAEPDAGLNVGTAEEPEAVAPEAEPDAGLQVGTAEEPEAAQLVADSGDRRSTGGESHGEAFLRQQNEELIRRKRRARDRARGVACQGARGRQRCTFA